MVEHSLSSTSVLNQLVDIKNDVHNLKTSSDFKMNFLRNSQDLSSTDIKGLSDSQNVILDIIDNLRQQVDELHKDFHESGDFYESRFTKIEHKP